MLTHDLYATILATIFKCLPDTTAVLEFQVIGLTQKRENGLGKVNYPYDDNLQLPGIFYTPCSREM